ncbi:endonuclease/exonuclease/phosphatase family protein [Cryptosporangium arvum]|uniref:Metal-dependent hydrolase n=1 Tax=Cryptosporangium arvum DSM 44712 TaxID=927661 RepID=A0A010Z3B0_9ACTN|nr:endonuclease/exonuclease/phosphatase family protein [Cryptosporangium arvum]EXG81898.1 metal-dependent hydrolase [Cryptosporangium arvum DSM 44712]
MTRVRVLTLNVQHDAGDPGRTARINAELRRLAPDIVVFPEVRYPDDTRDQLAELVDGVGLRTTHQAEILEHLPPDADVYGGSAIATRWPHRVLEVVDGRTPEGVYWYTLAASVELPGAGPVLLLTPTTFWKPDAEAWRERQMLELAALDARHRTRLPTIVAGDFNAVPESASIRFLSGLQSLEGRSAYYHDVWAVAGDGPGHTWTVDNPLGAAEIERLVGQPGVRYRIDYVFVGSGPGARVVGAAVVGEENPLSDHHGVLTDLVYSV